MRLALLVTAIIAAALGFSLRTDLAATPTMWAGLALPYAALSAFALFRMHRDGVLSATMRPRAGDVTVGFLLAAGLFAGAWAVRHFSFADGTPRFMWILRIALQLGSVRPNATVLACVAVIATMEELVWRGLVLSALNDTLGTRRAWPAAALLYGLAHLPTLFTLADPSVGPNPVLVMAALGAGIVWSFAASMMGRLPPVIISHTVFSYFVAAMLLPRFG